MIYNPIEVFTYESDVIYTFETSWLIFKSFQILSNAITVGENQQRIKKGHIF